VEGKKVSIPLKDAKGTPSDLSVKIDIRGGGGGEKKKQRV